jgi:hypothetical protein
MIKLQIKKEVGGVWQHYVISEDNFILSDCYCKTNGDKFRVVELGGSQRKEYNYSEIEVYDIGGTAETFTSSLELMQRLKALQYVGFINDGDVVIADLISSDSSNEITTGTDGKLFSSRPYKVYTALLTQTGTNAPTSIVLENTLGDIIWSRESIGNYSGTLSGIFTENKTGVFIQNSAYGSDYNNTLVDLISDNKVYVQVYDQLLDANRDDSLNNTLIEIRVYN